MEKEFKAFNHGNSPIDLTHYRGIVNVLPIEFHLKEDGSLTNGPSFAIVMVCPSNPIFPFAVSQLTIKMFNEALAEIGYELIKK